MPCWRLTNRGSARDGSRARSLDDMWIVRASFVALLVLAGCGDRSGPHDVDDWRPLLSLQEPVNHLKVEQSVTDATCLAAEGVKTIGSIDRPQFDQMVGVVRAKSPGDAIILVRAQGRDAEVWTGKTCHDPAGGRGDTHLLRRDDGRWLLKETTQWVK